MRWGDWHPDEDEWCLYVGAYFDRFVAFSTDGFRPVRGSVPEIEVVSSNVDVEKIKQELLRKARTDFAKDVNSLHAPELAKKYQL